MAHQEKLTNLLGRILSGETVDVGIFKAYEDFRYTRKKDNDGNPLFNRVISLVYFDENDRDQPSTEDFDGSIESLEAALDAHGAFDMPDDEE